MPLHMLPASPSDMRRACEVERVSYTNNPFSTVLFPGPFPPGSQDDRIADLTEQMREDPTVRWFKIVDDAIPAGEAAANEIAFAKWHVYETKAEPRPTREFGPGCNVEACEILFGELARQKERIMGDKPYVYLHLLHTVPEQQRRGAASILMQWGIDEAERLRLSVYLESSESGYPLYLKHGFTVVEELKLDFSKWGAVEPHMTWTMLKEPSAQ